MRHLQYATVTIAAPGSGTFSYAASPYCAGSGDVTPTSTLTGNGTFSAPGGLSLNTNTGVVNTSTSTPGTYTVTYTVPAANTCPAYSTTATITISPKPGGTFTYSGSPYCSATAPVNPIGTGLTAGGTYSAPAGLTINASTGQINPATSSAGNYTVTYTVAAANGCGVFATTATVGIGSSSVAPTGINASASTVCAPGDSVLLTVVGGSLGAGADWVWYADGCGTGSSIGRGSSIRVFVSRNTTFFVRAEGVCNTTACASAAISVRTKPSVTIAANNNNTVAPGSTTAITATMVPATPATGAYTITWYHNSLPMNSNANPLQINSAQYGEYYAVITDGVCAATSNTLQVSAVNQPGMTLSPNPGNGLIMVQVYNQNPSATSTQSVVVYDEKGARVFVRTYKTAGFYNNIYVDIQRLANGTYFVVALDDKGKKLATSVYLKK